MKKNVFLILGLVLAFTLVLSGCSNAAQAEVAGASNTKLAGPSGAQIIVGSKQLGFNFRASSSAKDYDVTYKFYVRQKDQGAKFEIVTGALATSPSGQVSIPNFFNQTRLDQEGVSPDGSVMLPAVGVGDSTAGTVGSGEGGQSMRVGPAVAGQTAGTDAEQFLLYFMEGQSYPTSPTAIQYGLILDITDLAGGLPTSPFAANEELEFAVQTVLKDSYIQKANLIDPSDFVWFSSNKPITFTR